MRLYGWENLTIGHHAANIDSLKHCRTGDKIILIGHVISKVI